MKGGVAFFRGTGGAAARRYLEQDQALNAAGYYTENNHLLATRTAYGKGGLLEDIQLLSAEDYQAWVEWVDTRSGEQRGKVKERIHPVTGKHETSVLMLDKTVNTSKDLSLAAVLNPRVSAALDLAMAETADAIGSYLVANLHTRIMKNGVRSWVEPEKLEIATVTHQTSRDGDPFRHIHLQVLNRVYAQGKWRALDTTEFTKHNAALNALGTAVIHGHPELRAALAEAGFNFDPKTGQITELKDYTEAFSQRTVAIAARKAELLADWQKEHPGQTPGQALLNQIDHQAWAHTRSEKTAETAADPNRWKQQLEDLGYQAPTQPVSLPPSTYTAAQLMSPEAIDYQSSRALALLSEQKSAWSPADVRATIQQRLADIGVLGTVAELEKLTDRISQAVIRQSSSVNPDIDPMSVPAHLPTLTSSTVLVSEQKLFDNSAALISRAQTYTVQTGARGVKIPEFLDASEEVLEELLTNRNFIDPDGQRITMPTDTKHREALAAMAGTQQLVVVTGPAGAGKTTLLKAAGAAVQARGGRQFIVAPSAKAAEVAGEETGSPTSTAHALLMRYGYTFEGDLDTGVTTWNQPTAHHAVPRDWALRPGDQLVVDEAGMLTQDVAIRLQEIALKTGAQIVFTGDYAQLAAVGRGGVLHKTAEMSPANIDLESVWRFKTAEGEKDQAYAELSLKMRARTEAAETFDELVARGLVVLHQDEEAAQNILTQTWLEAEAKGTNIVVAASTNEFADVINRKVAMLRGESGSYAEAIKSRNFVLGMEDQPITVGDVIRTRSNNRELGVLNGASYVVRGITENHIQVQSTGKDGTPHVLPKDYVGEHVQLGYARTVHSSQGMTVDTAHVFINGQMDGAGVYVGLTRGRQANYAHFVAYSMEEAREQFVAAVERHRADDGLDAARGELAKLVEGTNLEHPLVRPYRVLAPGGEISPGDCFSLNGQQYWVIENTANDQNPGVQFLRAMPVGSQKSSEVKFFTVGANEEIKISSERFVPDFPQAQNFFQDLRAQAQVQRSRLDFVDRTEEWAGWVSSRSIERMEYAQARGQVKVLSGDLAFARQELEEATGAFESAVAGRKNAIAQAEAVLAQAKAEHAQQGLLKRVFVPSYAVVEAERALAVVQSALVVSDEAVQQCADRVRGLESRIAGWQRKADEVTQFFGQAPVLAGERSAVLTDEGQVSSPKLSNVRKDAQAKLKDVERSERFYTSEAGRVKAWKSMTDRFVQPIKPVRASVPEPGFAGMSQDYVQQVPDDFGLGF